MIAADPMMEKPVLLIAADLTLYDTSVNTFFIKI